MNFDRVSDNFAKLMCCAKMRDFDPGREGQLSDEKQRLRAIDLIKSLGRIIRLVE